MTYECLHGPQIRDDGSIRFRLWAPSAEKVELELDGDFHLMLPQAGGWHMLHMPEAQVGAQYRYRIDGELQVPDPASRFQPADVNGPSEVTEPRYDWQDHDWNGRPWHEAVIYELHVGAFSPEGTYAGVQAKLDHLQSVGVTAIELLPVADYPGKRGWGYDGVLPYAPDSNYGRPEDLKALVQAAHAKGIMVFLDVVYNHFGPSGNYLHAYAKPFFTDKHSTPWGAAINFDDEGCEEVRRFFIDNALYWLHEFHIDGLRFDAVHAIKDDSKPHFLHELAETIHAHFPKRHVHLILENEHNDPALLVRDNGQPSLYTAQWNDDFHHACHVLMTGQTTGYYGGYADHTKERLARCLREGFDYQGEAPVGGKPRGGKCGHLPPLAFINHLQNHDQIGNRAMGDRLTTLVPRKQLQGYFPLLLLSPYVPMLYMGEEWGCENPFLFFCDFEGELADAVRQGRRREFAAFPEFSDPAQREKIPDPTAENTFLASKLDWNAQHDDWLILTQHLLALRQRYVMPLLASGWQRTTQEWLQPDVLQVQWHFAAGVLTVLFNLSKQNMSYAAPSGDCIYGEDAGMLPAEHSLWWVEIR